MPADIILDNILETRADLPISAIHMYSGYKADLYPLREGDELRALLHLSDVRRSTSERLLVRSIFILQKT